MKISTKTTMAAAAALALGALASPAHATMIGFEEFGNVGASGPAITTQYLASDGVTFSSNAGEFNQVSSQPGLADGLNFICTGSGAIDCANETTLTFTHGVSNLTFLAIGSNAPGVQALVDVWTGGVFNSTKNIVVGGAPFTPDLVDLSSFSNVTQIRIHGITDPAGLGWDDFSYTSSVPEPANLALMLAGLGLVGGLARRKR